VVLDLHPGEAEKLERDERLGWMGDAQAYIRTASYNADVAAFFKGFNAKRGDSLVAFGWAMAEDLAKLA